MGNALSLGLGSALPPSRSCLGLLFYVLFILPRETEEFSVQESRVLALLPRRMKAAEQTGGNQRRLRPAGFPHRRPRCQLLHKLGPGLPPCKPSSHPAAGLSPRLIGEHLLAVLFLGFFSPLHAQLWCIQHPALPRLSTAPSLHFISSQQFWYPQH